MSKTKAKLLLVFVFAARGVSFLFSKTLLLTMSPLNILAVRFCLAFLILSAIFFKKMRSCSKASLKGGLLLGSLYTVCMIFEMYGLKTVDTGVAALIENMAIVMVPVFVAVLTRTLPKGKTMLCALLAVAGVGFLSITQIEQSGSAFGLTLVISAALTYGVCIIATDKVSHQADPITIGVIQMGTMGLLCLILTFFTGGPALPKSALQWQMLLLLVLLCSCFGFTFQPLGQKYLSAETAAVFTVINPLAASILGFLAAGERLTVSKGIGCVLILTALLLYNLSWQPKAPAREKTHSRP